MPNWCSNDLIISGKLEDVLEVRERIKSVNYIKEIGNPNAPQEILDRIKEAIESNTINFLLDLKETNIDFNTAILYPLESKDAVGGGIDWAIKNWGVPPRRRGEAQDDVEEASGRGGHFDSRP